MFKKGSIEAKNKMKKVRESKRGSGIIASTLRPANNETQQNDVSTHSNFTDDTNVSHESFHDGSLTRAEILQFKSYIESINEPFGFMAMNEINNVLLHFTPQQKLQLRPVINKFIRTRYRNQIQ
jgi:hypothetical protein